MTTLYTDTETAFRDGDGKVIDDCLAALVNRLAQLVVEADRDKLTEFWRALSGVHYRATAGGIRAEQAGNAGYLEALYHVAKAVRDTLDTKAKGEPIPKPLSHYRGGGLPWLH